MSALAGLREVMSHINEDKRKTEGQLQMFDIYNDIDQCPVSCTFMQVTHSTSVCYDIVYWILTFIN